jgi:uncharacterized 2Fe-2S/4Fe-4S cluster protein (DUF4445 family)
MPTVKFIQPVKVTKKTPLLKLAKKAGLSVHAPCKKGSCQKCIVIVEGDVSKVTKNEKKAFSEEELALGYRLACEVDLLGKCKITLPTIKD